MKKINWPLAVLFAWLFLFLLAAASSQLEPRFCNSAMLETISKQQDVLIFNCFEFWLNRYQGLLSNLIIAAVAGFTLWALLGQLRGTNRQAAVAAAQGLRARIDELETETLAMSDPELGLYPQSFNLEVDPQTKRLSRDKIVPLAEKLRREKKTLDLWFSTCVGCLEKCPPTFREKLYREILDLTQQADEDVYFLLLKVNLIGLNNDEEYAGRAQLFSDRLMLIKKTAYVARGSIGQETKSTWRTIRGFEAEAVQGLTITHGQTRE